MEPKTRKTEPIAKRNPPPPGQADSAKQVARPQQRVEDNFRYCSKSIFLTYAQCPAPREIILEKLKTACRAPNQLLKACVGLEHHEDGNEHLHACAWYT